MILIYKETEVFGYIFGKINVCNIFNGPAMYNSSTSELKKYLRLIFSIWFWKSIDDAEVQDFQTQSIYTKNVWKFSN